MTYASHRPLRIAILAHSTNPRGGVVHALALGDALQVLGYHVSVHAPDASKRGFFRPARCETIAVKAQPAEGTATDLVRQRIDDYVAHFSEASRRRFDIFHAQDGISANALATLTERGMLPGFIRTVHHIDSFADPVLTALQGRAIRSAAKVLCVSALWRTILQRDYGIAATLVTNGVDMNEFQPVPDTTDEELRAQFGIGTGPVLLSVGGVEARKNTIRILEAFAAVRCENPSTQLLIAGGASLLDHRDYQNAFKHMLARTGLRQGAGEAVITTGPLPQRLMPALYRVAAALVFASIKEGFGLAVLEALASGTPVIVSRIAPFTEYLAEDDAVFVDPFDVSSITEGMLAALAPAARTRLAARGRKVAAWFNWRRSAEQHLAVYAHCAALWKGVAHA